MRYTLNLILITNINKSKFSRLRGNDKVIMRQPLMKKFKIKKNTKELRKIKKSKKKLLNPFSLQPLTDAYKNFKKKTKERNS